MQSAVDVLWIARYDYQKDWILRSHHHSYFQIIHFLNGKGTVMRRDEEHPIASGDTHLIRPGEVHGLSAASQIRTLDVKFEVKARVLHRELSLAPPLVQWKDSGLAARFERIRAEGEGKQHYFRELCASLLQEILYLYLRHGQSGAVSSFTDPLPDAPPQNELLQKTTNYVEANIGKPLTVKRIAAELGCSERSLRMHFQDGLKMSPLQFLHLRRIAYAKSLIEYSNYALKEIAILSGFQRVQHFNRVFKEVEGRTPASWRDNYLSGVRKDVYINPAFSNQILTELNSKTASSDRAS